MTPEFKDYARQIVKNCKTLEKFMKDEIRLVSGGTDSHLLLADLQQKVTGKQAEKALDEAGITVNKNTVPFDPRKPFDPSGIRYGSATLTSRGMKEKEMETAAELMLTVIKNHDNAEAKQNVRSRVLELCGRFPIYPGLN